MQAALPAPGAVVWIRQRRWRVERARRWRHVVRLDVRGDRRTMTFLAPFDTPSVRGSPARPVCARRREALARIAGALASEHRHVDLPCAVGAGVQLLPYQLEPALAMIAGARRVLLADEVGLGKTVQAALMAAELRRREPASRILIVTPAAIREQWREELAERFGLTSLVADASRLESAGRELARGDSPWRQAGIWVTSIDFVKQPHVLEALPDSPVDLLVLDEAHDAVGDSHRHTACRALASRARRVLLVTATPHAGDETRFGRLMALGGLSREHRARTPPLVFRRARADVGPARQRRVRWLTVRPGAAGQALLDGLLEYESRVLAAARARRREDAALLLLSTLRKRALSTALALRRSLERRVALLSDARGANPDWIQPVLDFDEAEDGASEADFHALSADVGLAVGHERSWLRRLLGLAAAAERSDIRPARLAALLGRTREPAIVFTEFRDSLDALARRLGGAGTTGLLHGGLTDTERHEVLSRFRSGELTVLVATDVASQGLNLQHRCRWVLNLELPWNPIRLEQRAGRVDRIGQTRDVRISLLRSDHPAEHRLLASLARRILTAQSALGTATLAGSLPEETDVRAAVITGDRGIDGPVAGTPVALCRRWQRPARRLARALERRRALAARWRSRHGMDGRPRLSCRQTNTGARDAIAIYSTPLVDGRGLVVERHVRAVRLTSAEYRRVFGPAGRERLYLIAARALAPRLRCLERVLRHEARDRIDLEKALAGAMAEVRASGEVQAGLFDRRAETAAVDAAADITRLESDIRERIDDAGRGAVVSVGPVRIEAVIDAAKP